MSFAKLTAVLLIIHIFSSCASRAEILFIDMNDAPKEIAYCQAGLDRKWIKDVTEGRVSTDSPASA